MSAPNLPVERFTAEQVASMRRLEARGRGIAQIDREITTLDQRVGDLQGRRAALVSQRNDLLKRLDADLEVVRTIPDRGRP